MLIPISLFGHVSFYPFYIVTVTKFIYFLAVNSLGKVTFKEEVGSLSKSDLGNFVSKCYPVIVNVRSGTHWVLVTGSTSSNNTWKVNDPYFSNTTYDYSDMSEFVVYDIKSSSFVSFRPKSGDHQDSEALISDAAKF